MQQRLLGVMLLSLGWILAYMCVYSPLEAVQHHTEEVSYSPKGAMFCPLILVVGLILLIFGQSATDALGKRSTRRGPKIVFMAVAILAIGAGAVLYVWLMSQLEQAGYRSY